MEKLDVVVAAVGAVVLVVALGGAAFYGGSVTLGSYDVTFAAEEAGLTAEEGAATGDGLTARYDVNRTNVTTFTVDVTITGSNPARAADVPVIVQVTGPGNLTGEAQRTLAAGAGTSLTLQVPVAVATIPEDVRVRATDTAAALAEADATNTDGTGAWTILVRAEPPVPGEDITAAVAPTVAYYVGQASPAAPPATP